MTRSPLLRPEFGPTLPQLLSGRLSVSPRTISIAAVVALVVAVLVVKVVIDDGRDQLTVHGNPSFNLLYDPSQLHRVAPHAGELARIEGRRGPLSTEITVRRANLPPYSGDVIGGQLPLYIAQYAQRLQQRLPDFVVSGEGKARMNQAPGYQFAYTAGPAGKRTFWREIWVMPEADQPRSTVVLSMRQAFSGRLGRRAQALLNATKKSYRSFRFGTGRSFFG